MTLRSTALPLLSLGLVLGVSKAQAVMLDDFTQGGATLTVASGTGTIEGQQAAANVFGAERDVLLGVTANPFNQMVRFVITGAPGAGASFYNGDTGTVGFAQLDYDGIDVEGNNGAQSAGPGLNLNLSAETGFVFNFMSADSPVQVDIMAVTYGGTDQVSVGSFTTAANISSNTSYTFNFADLTLGSGSTQMFDTSNVDRLVFRFTPTNPSGDFALGSIQTVPEPASVAILLGGVVGLVRLRKRRK